MSRHDQDPEDFSSVDDALKKQFDRIRDETAPERLLELARELQTLLRRRAEDDGPDDSNT